MILCFCQAAYEYANIGLRRDPLFLGPRMRSVMGILYFLYISLTSGALMQRLATSQDWRALALFLRTEKTEERRQ